MSNTLVPPSGASLLRKSNSDFTVSWDQSGISNMAAFEAWNNIGTPNGG
jgi:hypothetical protein